MHCTAQGGNAKESGDLLQKMQTTKVSANGDVSQIDDDDEEFRA